ncbi:MAG: N-acetylmuramoyl-L-alanine amidase [Sphingobacteriales bacterium]|nr:N-acetylmuramoyl-L-alanine amidase [Sphingobacteriales bacterium]
MLSIAYYLFKVIICSGILYGYYRLALHNKIFHRWNRFYLLAAVIMSLSFPLIKINIWHIPSDDDGQVIKLLNVVTTGDEMIMEADKNGSFHLTGEQGISILYLLVSLAFLVLLLHTLLKLSNLIRRHQVQKIEQINFVDTEARGTPFSFFRYIFWNHHIDVNSDTGKKIFLHELVHVQEKHSADRLFMNIVLIFFWCNPFFWLVRREMNMIHEFIADSKAVEDNDTSAFAAMILHAAYPQQAFGLTSNFFNSSIKRRLLMLTKMKNPRVSYISRILALPLLTVIFLAFTIKTKTLLPQDNENIKLEKVFTVVVDAGHGGEDPGAKAADGTTEKSFALAIVQKVKQLNSNANIRVMLSRETDIFQPVRDKVKWTLEQKPDAFISVHINNTEEQNTQRSGFDLYVSRKENPFDKESRLLGSLITKEIAQTYTIAPDLKQRKEQGIWVLDAPDITYPAVLIQCGYINNTKDLAFISNASNQEKIAKDILKGIERFAKEAQTVTADISPSEPSAPQADGNNKKPVESTEKIVFTAAALKDTLPVNIKSIDFTKDDNVIIIYKNDKAEKITREEAVKRGLVDPALGHTNITLRGRAVDSVLYMIDGVAMTTGNMESVDPNDIESITVLRDGTAIEKYGEKGRNGVIEIITKSNKAASTAKGGSNIVFQKVETEASFPGGEDAWVKYISSALKTNIDDLKKDGKSGTCLVQFIVNKDGSIREAEALTMKGTKLAEAIINAINKGPKWNPAMQNGIKVTSYRKQPVTFKVAG